MKQVDKDSYLFNRYSFPGRWVSYYHQISLTLACEPKTILEIGVGDKVFANYVKQNTSIEYKCLDVAEDLEPDILGSVTSIPLTNNSVDAVCAFEVLEHLPFDQFSTSISEIARIAKKYAIISLPHYGPALKASLKLPFLPELQLALKLPFPRHHTFNGQHYWEIGKRQYPASRIRKILQEFFIVEREFIPFENQYHHFFLLRKKSL